MTRFKQRRHSYGTIDIFCEQNLNTSIFIKQRRILYHISKDGNFFETPVFSLRNDCSNWVSRSLVYANFRSQLSIQIENGSLLIHDHFTRPACEKVIIPRKPLLSLLKKNILFD